MPERRREVDGRCFYLESWIPSIAVRYQSNVRVSSLEYTVTGTREVFDDECPDPSFSGIVVSGPTVADDDKSDWDWEDMPSGLSSRHEQRRMVLSNIQGLGSHKWLPAVENGLDVLPFKKNGFPDRLTFMQLRWVLPNE